MITTFVFRPTVTFSSSRIGRSVAPTGKQFSSDAARFSPITTTPFTTPRNAPHKIQIVTSQIRACGSQKATSDSVLWRNQKAAPLVQIDAVRFCFLSAKKALLLLLQSESAFWRQKRLCCCFIPIRPDPVFYRQQTLRFFFSPIRSDSIRLDWIRSFIYKIGCAAATIRLGPLAAEEVALLLQLESVRFGPVSAKRLRGCFT